MEADQLGRARLLSAATPVSGVWLHAVPAASLGANLDHETLRIAIALRVGADVCSEHRRRCGSLADKGHHSLTCRFSAGRQHRHTALSDVIRRALDSALVPAILEPHGIGLTDGKRPDGMPSSPSPTGKTCCGTPPASTRMPRRVWLPQQQRREAPPKTLRRRNVANTSTSVHAFALSRWRLKPVAHAAQLTRHSLGNWAPD